MERGLQAVLDPAADQSWGEWLMTASALPDGTVTFLLTDLEGSTAQWEADGDAMATATARHYEVLDTAIRAHRGFRPIEQGEGDSVVAAFSRASDAVLAAIDAQRDLAAEPWPAATPLKVRMAIHTGEARVRDASYYMGGAIVRTARLRAIAHGGQVLLSSAARDLAVDELGTESGLLDLGVHKLKDLSRPEHVWQLTHVDLETEFPALRSLNAVPSNLPASLSSFIGRSEAIDTIARLAVDNRLLTLTGSGGAGKTRLALEVARQVTASFPGGVWWIDLVNVRAPELLASAISRAASLPEDRADRLGGVIRRLASKRALLVFDNCEHLVDAAAETIASILSACPELTVVTTSRASLNVPGELSWRVPPLAVSDAVRLFADRATKARDGFRLTDDNHDTVAEICARLDGVPLAIELAAARARAMTPRQILDGLGDALGLLAGAGRGVSPRQQTIDASIQWSYSLLSTREQKMMRRLAVFAGRFTQEAAEAVASDETISTGGVLELLSSLVDQSLVQMEDQNGVALFRMLETVRQFARRELVATDEYAQVVARHAAHFAERGRALWPFFQADMSELLEQADVEFEDLRMMLEHVARHSSPDVHAEIAMACLPAMSVRHMAEAAALGDQVAARVDPMSVLGGTLHFQLAVVDPTMSGYIGAGIAAAEATGDPHLRVHADWWASTAAAAARPTADALAAVDAAQDALRAIGETHFSRAYWIPAAIVRPLGDDLEFIRRWNRATEETVCKRCSVMVWSEGALVALAQGDLERAQAYLDRAEALAVEVRDAGFTARARLTATLVAIYAGKPPPVDEIEADLREGLATGNPAIIGYMSEARAAVRLAGGPSPEADEDLQRCIAMVDGPFGKRIEARLQRAALQQALGNAEEARAITHDLRDNVGIWVTGPRLHAQIDHREAALALDSGDAREADDLAHRALAEAAVGPHPPLVIGALELISSVAVARESYTEAARLHGAAARLRDAHGFRADFEPERSRLARDLTTALESLGEAAFDAAVDEGRALSLEDAMAYARRARGERKRPTHGWDGLTPTEWQVARLAVQGLTNAEIAEQLFIGRETVKTHLSSIYSKVGVANRTQLVADAARRRTT